MIRSHLEVVLKPELNDAEGERVKRKTKNYFDIDIEDVRTVDVKTIESENLSEVDLENVKEKIFTNPVTQVSSYDSLVKDLDWNHLIWVGYRPGVMDPAGQTGKEAICDLTKKEFGEGEGVYTSKIYLLKGNVGKEDVEKIANEMLFNDIIQRSKVMSREGWEENGFEVPSPKVILDYKPTVTTLPLKSNEELKKLSDERNMALNPKDVPTITKYFKREDVREERKKYGLGDPTDIELEYIAQARSDHCNHNTFNGKFHYRDLSTGEKFVVENMFDEFIKNPTLEIAEEKDWVVSVLWDNAGIAKFDENYNYTISIETHNSPTNIEARGGAITGNVGEFRDKLGAGLGSKVFLGLYGFGTALRNYAGKLKPKLHPRR
ncbi:MAG: phosphoribosylformylglycinamidine synthase subunit PurS, partial [Candidatus Aenigmarchaeota archaeon]|nr:phosphoribosylformylglycinamidine synthase subunit PurS [Candidatus Aenigmarchaeota archaeon]